MNQNIKTKIQQLLHQELDEIEFSKRLKQIAFEQDSLNVRVNESSEFKDLFQNAKDYLERNSAEQRLFPTYFFELDNVIGGFSPSEFVVIGGRPGMGKTQFLVNLALNLSKKNGVLYFSFDLNKEMITNRFISCMTKIPITFLMKQNLNTSMKDEFDKASKNIGNYQLYLNDSCHNSIEAFKTLCKKHVEENNVKFIIVDYLQLMSSRRFSRNREMEISQISRELKMIANDYNICVIASSQLSRSVETRGGDKRPILSDLRESGAIEQDADKVFFIYRPEYYNILESELGESNSGKVEIIVAKNRNGVLDSAKLSVDKNFTHFSNFHQVSTDFMFSLDRLKELDDSINKNDSPF
jgi:replicative DNA helicase